MRANKVTVLRAKSADLIRTRSCAVDCTRIVFPAVFSTRVASSAIVSPCAVILFIFR